MVRQYLQIRAACANFCGRNSVALRANVFTSTEANFIPRQDVPKRESAFERRCKGHPEFPAPFLIETVNKKWFE